MRTKSLKAEGDNVSSSATVNRLNTQLNGKDNDVRLLMSQRVELEKVLQAAKGETMEAERRADDYRRQLISTKENLDILHSE